MRKFVKYQVCHESQENAPCADSWKYTGALYSPWGTCATLNKIWNVGVVKGHASERHRLIVYLKDEQGIVWGYKRSILFKWQLVTPAVGAARIGGKQRPIINSREIKRGKRKGHYEVTTCDGKKAVIQPHDILTPVGAHP